MILFDIAADPFSGIVFLISILIAVTVHEFSHAYASDKLGDPTARVMGRLTLNPLAHLDPLGTLLFLFIGFGWGKPVPFDPFNLKNPKKDAAIISLAGPLSNIILFTIAALILRVVFILNPPLYSSLFQLLFPFAYINLALAFFNLIPVHPLDGFKIVEGLLPEEKVWEWRELKAYGSLFLLMLIIPIGGQSLIQRIIIPLINISLKLLIP